MIESLIEAELGADQGVLREGGGHVSRLAQLLREHLERVVGSVDAAEPDTVPGRRDAALEAGADARLAAPDVDRLLTDPEHLGDLGDLPPSLGQIDHLTAKPRRISPSCHLVLRLRGWQRVPALSLRGTGGRPEPPTNPGRFRSRIALSTRSEKMESSSKMRNRGAESSRNALGGCRLTRDDVGWSVSPTEAWRPQCASMQRAVRLAHAKTSAIDGASARRRDRSGPSMRAFTSTARRPRGGSM